MRLSGGVGVGGTELTARTLPGGPSGRGALLRVTLAGLLASVLGALVMAAPAAASPQKQSPAGRRLLRPVTTSWRATAPATGSESKLAACVSSSPGTRWTGWVAASPMGSLHAASIGCGSQGPGTITGYFVGMSLDSVNDSRVQQQRRTNRIRLLLPDLPVQRVVVGGQKMNIKEGGR